MFPCIIFKLSCAREGKSLQQGGGVKNKLGMQLLFKSEQVAA